MSDRDPQFEQFSRTNSVKRSWSIPTLTQCTVPLPLLSEIRAALALNERTASMLHYLLQDPLKGSNDAAQMK